MNDQQYHSKRAKAERELAYGTANEVAANVHLRLSALHLSRAMILQEVDRQIGEERQGSMSG